MISTQNFNKRPQRMQENNHKDEIDLLQVADVIMRHRGWVAKSSFLGLIVSSIYIILSKPVYQGEFQIVLNQSSSLSAASGIFSQNAGLAALAGLSGSGVNDSIATEVQILNSPSVLRPVFEEVKRNKPESVRKNLIFQDWVDSAITVQDEKGTSVLNVEFRDTDKTLVLPITQMISKAYQAYSNRGRDRDLANVISYLKTQISRTKPQAELNSRKALEYGYVNGLGILDGLPLAGNVSGAGVGESSNATANRLGRGGTIESARTAAQQKIKGLEVQIEEATKAGTGSLYFASQLASLTDKSSTFDQLTSVETRLAELRSRLKDNDPLVEKLERERKTLVKYINLQTIALLRGELDLAKSILQSLDRPKEVISRHRELTQKALRDEATLVTLQNQLKQFQLEQARASSPWELISTPTVLDKPVSPRRGRTMALGLLAGLVMGCASALLKDRRTGRIFTCNELLHSLPGSLLERLPNKDSKEIVENWQIPIQLLADGPLKGASTVALIPCGID